jgi:hypothetical protein
VREEGGCHARREQRVRVAGDETGIGQDACKDAVRLDVQLGVIDASANAADDIPLRRIHTLNELRESRVIEGMRARDV